MSEKNLQKKIVPNPILSLLPAMDNDQLFVYVEISLGRWLKGKLYGVNLVDHSILVGTPIPKGEQISWYPVRTEQKPKGKRVCLFDLGQIDMMISKKFRKKN